MRDRSKLNAEKDVSIYDLKLPEELKLLSFSQCENLCTQIRNILIETVSKTGGHLASNLGTVELAVAIHRVFDSPRDKIIWDVGHQAYAHKILTGRLERFATLRQENGISGFPRPDESEHDAFISGHSSNSISAAFGIARGMKLQGKNNHTIAVIGDGAFTGGMAYEGLNNAGKSDDNIIIILNHNDMSISKNVGALAKYLSEIRAKPGYLDTKYAIENILDKTPLIGKPLKKAIKTSKSVLKGMLYHSTMFEDFGFVYLGPVDGHNIAEIEKTLITAKRLKRPVFVHVNTVKGKGFEPAEKNPGAFHGISKNDMTDGNPEIISDDSFSAVFGHELNRLAGQDGRICAITAAMKYATGLNYFYAEHKDRFFDVGIAEQHAVTFAAGLSKTGMIPVFAVYSSFLQRSYDQVLHDAAIDNSHIVLAIDRAGIVGEDGETHQGIFDAAFLSTIPNVTLFSPSCYEELKMCLNEAVFDLPGIVGVRYPKGNDLSEFDKSNLNTFYTHENSKSDILLVTYGRIYNELLKAQKFLSDEGIFCDMLKMVKIFPVEEEIIEILKNYKNIFFFEEGIRAGGIAEHIASRLVDADFSGRMHISAINGFVKQASVSSALDNVGLSASKMTSFVIRELKNGEKT
ncbi:MAG: 1-deoxy-D-xylulose-5-phosphate synthase [Oscillospiraceae bacterium]|jgi:1-deoxy-D-xylulose-5-phosphate synthase|nr:1-deoxy-D-xylulose-5-phosphate synthase [Oscillospiraceae bacterium]